MTRVSNVVPRATPVAIPDSRTRRYRSRERPSAVATSNGRSRSKVDTCTNWRHIDRSPVTTGRCPYSSPGKQDDWQDEPCRSEGEDAELPSDFEHVVILHMVGGPSSHDTKTTLPKERIKCHLVHESLVAFAYDHPVPLTKREISPFSAPNAARSHLALATVEDCAVGARSCATPARNNGASPR